MIVDEFRINFWRMFFGLEKELVEVLDYVELNTNNYATNFYFFKTIIKWRA